MALLNNTASRAQVHIQLQLAWEETERTATKEPRQYVNDVVWYFLPRAIRVL